MKSYKMWMVALLVVIFGIVTFVPQVFAVPMLRLTDVGTGDTVTIMDGGALDLADVGGIPDGIISYLGMDAMGTGLGVFSFTITTGMTAPELGTLAVPRLHLDSVETSSSGAGTLLVEFSADGFTGPIPNPSVSGFTTTVGGVSDGTLRVETFIDTDNIKWGGMLLTDSGTLGVFGSTDSVGDVSVGLVPVATGPYALSVLATIVHEAGDTTSFNVAVNPVPEPTTMLLFGSGMIGLVAWRRFKTKA